MSDFLNKLSSYNLFNYLFPGTLFAVLADKLTKVAFIQDDLIIGFFLYYFIGLIISRFGSLVLEPLLKEIKFLKFSNYRDFVKASIKDQKIELLSEVNNTYRTLCSLIVLLALTKIFFRLETYFNFLQEYRVVILIILLFIMFILSYRKQTNYINKRVQANKE